MTDIDPSSTGCFMHFDKCCFCIDLKAGAHILGIFAMIGGGFGVIELIIYFTNPSWPMLAIACLATSNIFPAIGYGMMLAKPNKESKNRFALWYLLGFGVGCILYCLFLLIAGAIAYALTAPLISLCICWYFYCCLKSYANKDDEAI